MPQKKVAIIGAGIGGLSCAARLAACGCSVTIFERHETVGGKLGLLQQDGFSWDTGPSLFTQPYLLEQLFRDCGKHLSDYFSYHARDEGTQYFWEDGTTLHASPDHATLAANIRAAMNVPADAFLQYLKDAASLYQHIGSIFLDKPIHRRSTWKMSLMLPALKALKARYLLSSLHDYNTHALKHPKLVQLMDRMATYNGSDPYQCPAMLSMIAHLELNEGAWYPAGGMISIPRALRRLCDDLDVQFAAGADVRQIQLSGKTALGVVADGTIHTADAVVSNSDVYYTYRNLLGDAAGAARIQQQERSSSGIVFYWGIRAAFPQLRLHNIFFSKEYEAEFQSIFGQGLLYPDPTIYINITSKAEAEHAPEGCENWFVLINAPAMDRRFSAEEMAMIRLCILRKLARMLGMDVQALEALIASEQVLTPDDIEQDTGSYLGALYGTASNSPMAAFNRHPNFSKAYPGLFFAGGTVHPGGGIPLCLRSGRLAAEEVIRYLR